MNSWTPVPILLLPDSHKDIFTNAKHVVISYQASAKSRLRICYI